MPNYEPVQKRANLQITNDFATSPLRYTIRSGHFSISDLAQSAWAWNDVLAFWQAQSVSAVRFLNGAIIAQRHLYKTTFLYSVGCLSRWSSSQLWKFVRTALFTHARTHLYNLLCVRQHSSKAGRTAESALHNILNIKNFLRHFARERCSEDLSRT